MGNPKTDTTSDTSEQPNTVTPHLTLTESPKNSNCSGTASHSSSTPVRSPADSPAHLTFVSSPENPSESNSNHGGKAKSSPPPARSPVRSSGSSDCTSIPHISIWDQKPLDSPQEKSHIDVLESPPPPQPEVGVGRSVQEEPMALTKLEFFGGGGGDGRVEETGGSSGVGGGGGVGGSGRRSRPGLSILRRTRREEMVKKAALGFRALGALGCLISFSVMAADRSKGWALDSFYRYKEFRYSMSVNVIGFMYSAGQLFDLVYHLAIGKYAVRHPYRYYFDFAGDQIMTYLLISASSSATTRIDDWKSNWGEDKFPDMATASVSISFLAFVALAFSSLISGYALCTSKSLQF